MAANNKRKPATKKITASVLSPDERKQLREMELMLRIAKHVAGIDTLDELLTAIVAISAKETGADRGTLFLDDAQTGELYSRVAQGNRFREIRILNNQGIAGYVFTSGQGLIVEDAYADPRFDRVIDEETGYVTHRIACAPIRTVKGEIIGVLQVLNKKHGQFTPDDLRLLEAMAHQTALTLRNTQVVEGMKAARQEEMQFLDLLADITSDFDLSAMLSKIVTEAAKMLRADRATLFLNDEKTKELFSRVAMGDSVGEIRLPNHVGIAGAVFKSGQTINNH
jgi:adenylate cyclase